MKTSKKATGVVKYGSDLPALRRNLARVGLKAMSVFEEQMAQEYIREQYPRYRRAKNNALLPWQFAMVEVLKMRNFDFTAWCDGRGAALPPWRMDAKEIYRALKPAQPSAR